jgi:membrane-anchored protein YejM (alkaline phosphatase superfamily)
MELSLLDLTPIGSLDLAREPLTDPEYAIQQLEDRGRYDEPFFLYAHIISPHSPSRFDEDCNLRSRFAYFSIPTKTDQDKRNYVQDVRCLNANVLRAIDAIQGSDPDAYIIVASDHGSKFIPDQYKRLEDWRPEALREEFGNLVAMYLPDRCRDSAEKITNTVNTFRVVAACLEGTAPDMVEDRAFLWPATGPGPQELDDLTVLDPVD